MATQTWAFTRWIGRTSRINAAEVPLLDRFVLAAGVLSLVWYVCIGRVFTAAVAAVVLPLTVFFVRSHRGHRVDRVQPRCDLRLGARQLQELADYWRANGAIRRRQNAPANTLSVALAVASASLAAAVQGGGPARLPLAATVAWSVAAAALLALVMARGHEIRLRGSYATQSAWLRMNRVDLTSTYFHQEGSTAQVSPQPPATQGQPEPGDGDVAEGRHDADPEPSGPAH